MPQTIPKFEVYDTGSTHIWDDVQRPPNGWLMGWFIIGFTTLLKMNAYINIPSRRFPYVRFAQFHHHQVHLKFISCVFRVGKIKCFCAACTK